MKAFKFLVIIGLLTLFTSVSPAKTYDTDKEPAKITVCDFTKTDGTVETINYEFAASDGIYLIETFEILQTEKKGQILNPDIPGESLRSRTNYINKRFPDNYRYKHYKHVFSRSINKIHIQRINYHLTI